jgi:hypothetical protein
MTTALDAVEGELRRLGAVRYMISTNVQTRLDGRPYANQARPRDAGVAVYFTLAEKRVVLPCDKWMTVEENLYAIAKHVEALRGQQRWGVSSLERDFAGYAALNERTEASCWEALGIAPAATEAQIVDAWRAKAKMAHPDVPGGSHEAFASLSQAKDIALATARTAKAGAR